MSSDQALIAEPGARYGPDGGPAPPVTALKESDLSRIWEGQTFPPEAMTTSGGDRLRVIYRGRRGRGAGPDFRDAIVAAPAGLLEGDVELHVRSSDFRRHGHHLDPAYDGLAMHLVLRHDGGADTLLHSGRRVPVVALADWLEARTGQLIEWLQRPPVWQEPCRSAVSTLGPEAVSRTLQRLGEIRFRQKTAALGKDLSEAAPDEVFWSNLLEALGYGGHRERFREIAAAVPWRLLRRRLTAAGSASSRKVLATQLLSAASARSPGTAPFRGSIRPANRLERRLAGAAALAGRYAESGFTAYFLSLLETGGRIAVRSLIRSLSVEGSIGRSRAIEIAANAVLPLLAALEKGRWERSAEGVYALLPLPARYGPVRHLHDALPDVRIDSRRQQGMLYLLGQYCTRGGCGRCPLS
jgi:hypothetical protein